MRIRVIVRKGSKTIKEKFIESRCNLPILDSPSFVIEETTVDKFNLVLSYIGSSESKLRYSIPRIGELYIGKYTGRIIEARIMRSVDFNSISTATSSYIVARRPLSEVERRNVTEGSKILQDIISR